MERKLIFEKMLSDIATRLNNSSYLTHEEKEDFEDNLTMGLDKAVTFLKGFEHSGIDEYNSIYFNFINFTTLR